MESGQAQEVVHINTGIGIEETRVFVRETCRHFHWPLRELHPPEWTYEYMVTRKGFPGPGSHRYCYSWLKERAIRVLIRSVKNNRRERVGLIAGVRQQESVRRMGYVKPVAVLGAQVWIANIFQFGPLDKAAYIQKHNLTVNPVTKILGMSGECLCGAFAEPGELEEKIRPAFPKAAAEIDRLADKAFRNGKHDVWGTRPPGEKNLDQYDIPFMPMCSGCPHR